MAMELKNVFETYDLEIKTESQVIRERFEALKDVSFSIKKGEAVAIVGPNGAGKSTLLRIMAGLLRPEKGDIRIHGRVSSLLDLGAGFHPELTGRDNLLLNASLYNFSREEMHGKLEQVLLFADIGKFIDVPVRCYSQGMYVRLAFSLAIHVDPDILLIDDCLAVGDDNFRLKSIDKVLEFKSRNKTIVFVTHDFGSARQVCGRGIYLREGRILKDGDLDEVVGCYVSPLQVDRKRYKYLGAKIVEEEDRGRADEADRQRKEEDRRSLEQAAWRDAQEVENRSRQEAWRRDQAEHQRLEQVAWREAQAEQCRSEQEVFLCEQAERNRLEQAAWREAKIEQSRSEQEAFLREQVERNHLEQAAWREAQVEQIRLEQAAWCDEQTERHRLEQAGWREAQAEQIRLEQDAWRRQEQERCRLDQELRIEHEELGRIRQAEQDAMCRQEEEERRKLEEARRSEQRAKRKACVELLGAHGLRVVVAPGKVRLFRHEKALTDDDGVRTLFDKNDFMDIASSTASWWVIKTSETSVVCFLRWNNPARVSQIWHWKVMPDGIIDLRIDTKSLDGQSMENLRVECRLRGKRAKDAAPLSAGKIKRMLLDDDSDVVFSTSQDDQVTGSYPHGEDQETLYFLTVCGEQMPLLQGGCGRHPFFRGGFEVSGKENFPAVARDAQVAHEFSQGKLKVSFREGCAALSRQEIILTCGLGLYTSLYARGVWYDSTQARWSIVSSDAGRLVVKGRWPWVPVVQTWDISLVSDQEIRLGMRMRVLKGFSMKACEMALMLDPVYRDWSTGDDFHAFPLDVTRDDFLRICLSSRAADGKNTLILRGDNVPLLALTPAAMPGRRIVLENAAHVGGAHARLLHCLRVQDQQDLFIRAGEYDLFKGHINISGGQA